MTKNTKVLCAMSGGVDSSVSAALLKEQGYNVIGVTMQIHESSKEFGGCCGINEINDAKAVCSVLDIPHYTLNLRRDFKRYVIDNFIEEYKNGRTPNPCIRCNQFLKFDLLIKKADELGCDYIATGHYAQIMPSPLPLGEGNKRGEGFYKFFKAIDSKKDQSYVLYNLNQKNLSRILFPLGEFKKEEVRKMANKFELPTAEKKESQEICFILDNNYGNFIKEKIHGAVKPGNILDSNGKIIGKHNGIIFYTIGQKKGIGAHGVKKFVTQIDVKNNAIAIGDNNDLLQSDLTALNLNFISGAPPFEELEITAKIRYNSPESQACLKVINNTAYVNFSKKQRAITPGQSVVFYKGDEVIGGGIIN